MSCVRPFARRSKVFRTLLAGMLWSFVASSLMSQVVDLHGRLELFADDFVIESLSGDAQKVLQKPEPKEVVFTTDGAWEGNLSGACSIFQDGEGYRMYYRGAAADTTMRELSRPEVTCMAESKDGIHWTRPILKLHEWEGSKENNIVWKGETPTHNMAVFKDENPQAAAGAQYKAVIQSETPRASQSPDGLHWSPVAERPLPTEGPLDSENVAFWDSQEDLNCPFYQLIGNHDYEEITPTRRESVRIGPRKCEAELDYARDNPTSRWKMPWHWYAVELPDAENPLVKIVVWDSNHQLGTLTPQQKIDQQLFLKTELAKPTRAPWLWLAGHHPMFTSSSNKRTSGQFLDGIKELIRESPVSFYLSGHDHSLQHLEVEGFKNSFIVSGAGGGWLGKVDPVPNGFSQSVLGFNHFHVTPEWVDTQFIDADGNLIHAFRRTVAGEVSILPVS